MREKGSIELHGFYNTNYGIYKKISEETKSNNSFELGSLLSILNNLVTPFQKYEDKQYGTKIDLTFISDLLCKNRKSIGSYVNQLEEHGYIETTILKNNTKYYKITQKGKSILKIKKK